ncbi:MAG TPA: hypothetical protein VEC13_01405 [Candidatus Paceibacterota bacterium]|nr:hypothetical protein [Candidatus Paceibacterota bacterium]
MTVGELVYQQMKDGYVPTVTLSDGFISTLNRTAEESQKLVETLRKPFENMQKTMERLRPSLEAMENLRPRFEEMSRTIPRLAPSFIPSLYEEEDEDLIIPALKGSVQEYVVEDSALARQERALSSYILPGNADWSLLKFQFLDGHTVRVSYPGKESMKFTYTEMGFVNERTMNPDMKWQLLKMLAVHGGALTNANRNWDRRFHRNIKYELNEGLKRFFGMTTSPIPRYTRRNGYMTLFVIHDDR